MLEVLCEFLLYTDRHALKKKGKMYSIAWNSQMLQAREAGITVSFEE